jgi:ribosomal protein S18 acetylase RimI-like enzyme
VNPLRLRPAGPDDADPVARLHADSWCRHYRGAYADSFLDGDVVSNRLAVWTQRLASPARTRTIVATQNDELVGFAHVVLDACPRWGSLVDNLHVLNDRRRSGIGSQLLSSCLSAVAAEAFIPSTYLWVLEQNVAAQAFYEASGAVRVETGTVPPPGGDPTRLNGRPRCLRMAWSPLK